MTHRVTIQRVNRDEHQAVCSCGWKSLATDLDRKYGRVTGINQLLREEREHLGIPGSSTDRAKDKQNRKVEGKRTGSTFTPSYRCAHCHYIEAVHPVEGRCNVYVRSES